MNRQQSFSKHKLGCVIRLRTDGSESDNRHAKKTLDAIAETIQDAHPDAFVVVEKSIPTIQDTWEMLAIQRPEQIATFTGGPLHRQAIAAIVKTATQAYDAMAWLAMADRTPRQQARAQAQAIHEINEVHLPGMPEPLTRS